MRFMNEKLKMKLEHKRLRRLFLPAILAVAAFCAAGCQDGLSDTVVVSDINARGPRLKTSIAVTEMDDPSVTKSSFAGGESAEGQQP